jgi:hypothetical protein
VLPPVFVAIFVGLGFWCAERATIRSTIPARLDRRSWSPFIARERDQTAHVHVGRARCGARRLTGRTLVADPPAQSAIVHGVEPDRDQHRPAHCRRLDQFGVLERGRGAAIGDRRESLGVCRPLGSEVRSFPAANLGVKLLAVVAPDPVVDGPAVLLGRRDVGVSTTSAIGGTVPNIEATPRRRYSRPVR